MVLTDIDTGRTECLPLVARSGALVIEALAGATALFPFPLRGVDFDNDGLFMNEPVITWCRGHGLEVTRSRAYRKNDQAWVEQKNGAIVRCLVGYGRLEGIASAQALVRLYAAARLHTNLFQPSFKLKQKTRIGARVIKRYHAPEIPTARALAHPAVTAERKAALQRLHARSDPVQLITEIRAAQAELGKRIDRRGLDGAHEPAAPVDLEQFAIGLRIAWRHGEQRPPIAAPIGGANPCHGVHRCWMTCMNKYAPGSPRRLALLRPRFWSASRLCIPTDSRTSRNEPCSVLSSNGARKKLVGSLSRAPLC